MSLSSSSKKNWPVKKLGGWFFICLRPPPLSYDPITPPPPLTHCICVYIILNHTRKGGSKPEKRLERSKISTWLTLTPVYKLYKTPIKTTFRVWCLYSYLVHGLVPLGPAVPGPGEASRGRVDSTLQLPPRRSTEDRPPGPPVLPRTRG